MKTELPNRYELAFESWLKENHIPYICIDQTRRFQGPSDAIKNFDFLIRPDSNMPVLTELKGRTFEGTTLAGLKRLDGWVTFEDVRSLSYWLDKFRQDTPQAQAFFVFAFRFKQIDIETDGMEVYDWAGERFLFLAILLKKYMDCMKIRSPKWRTVVLPA